MASSLKAPISLADLSQQLKQCTALSLEEIRALREFAIESGLFDADNQTPSSNWTPAGTVNGAIKVAKQLPVPPERVYKIRGITTMPYSVDALKEGVFNKEMMMKWDIMLRDMKELTINGDHATSGIIRSLAWSRFGVPGFSTIVSERDFVVSILVVHLPTDVVVAMVCSIAPDEPAPAPFETPAKGVVRGHLGASGWVFVPNTDGTTLVSMILQVDPMGWIPASVTNFASSAIPYNLVRLNKVLKKQGKEDFQKLKQQRVEKYKYLPPFTPNRANLRTSSRDGQVVAASG